MADKTEHASARNKSIFARSNKHEALQSFKHERKAMGWSSFSNGVLTRSPQIGAKAKLSYDVSQQSSEHRTGN